MAATPREIGTLIIVVLKANHLPNKRHIGKQDPYCAVTFNGQTRRTKAIKKGGQHPEWDEEVRFQVYEDDQDAPPARLGDGTPPPLPPKNDKITSIKGGMMMKVACYADDAREPDLIGEGMVDLTEVISKGESDEWYTLTYKDRFAGKVYLEMTLYSNEPEPPKKKKASTLQPSGEYVGPGEFVAEGGQTNRIVSASVVHDYSRRQSDSYSIRPSSSLAQLDLYQAPYENQAVDSLTNSFGEFGVGGRRRETLPSSISSYRPASSTGFSTMSSQSSLSSTYRPVTPNDQPSPYPPEHQPSNYRPPPPVRKGRYSIPTSSSGFMPLSTSASTLTSSASSAFNMPHVTGGYGPPLSHTPIPAPYNPPPVMYDAIGGYPTPSHTPLPSNGPSSIPYDAGDYHPVPSQTPFPTSYSNLTHSQHSFENGSSLLSHSESYPYLHHGTVPAPPTQLAPPPPPASAPISSHSTHPEGYTGYTVHSSSRDNLSSGNSPGGSRPLPPQPQGFVQPPPLPLSQQQSYGTYNNSYVGTSGQTSLNGFPAVPPPPPIPPARSQSPLHDSPQPHFTSENQYTTAPPSTTLSVPPPPQHTSRRRTSLPQPPVQASALYPSLPALPAPPTSGFQGIPPPPPILPSHLQSFYPGPPPKPPTQPLYYVDSNVQSHSVYPG